MNNTSHKGDNQFWIGLFLGALMGIVLLVLLGTEKGKKLIKQLEEKGLDFLDEAATKIEETVEKVEEKGEVLMEKSREVIHHGQSLEAELAQKVVAAKHDMEDSVMAKADDALAHIEALQERGRASTAEIRRKLFKNIPKKS